MGGDYGARPGPRVSASGLVPTPSRRLHTVSYTHLRAHETVLDLVCRLLLEKKKKKKKENKTIKKHIELP